MKNNIPKDVLMLLSHKALGGTYLVMLQHVNI